MDARAFLRDLYDTAVNSARPEYVLPEFVRGLVDAGPRRTLILGAGKAASQMARSLEFLLPEPPTEESMVVTRYGHGVPCSSIRVVEAGHPLPDAASVWCAERMLQSCSNLTEGDLMICLLTGGGSSLLALPPETVSLEDLGTLNRELLRCGACIAEINCVRRHVSLISGGRLALACGPARVATLAISDVVGDSPSDIASGPTVADPTTRFDALEVLDRYALQAPPSIRAWLETEDSESVKPEELSESQYRIVASAQMALEAAKARADAVGVPAIILSDSVQEDSQTVAREHAAIAVKTTGPCVLLSGGETTVKVSGKGQGGRNVEYLAALALALNGAPGIHALAADTDGVDGTLEIAGAWIDPTTLARSLRSGRSVEDVLHNHDAHTLFQRLGDSLVTGPTGTNVNDFRAIYVE